LPALFLVFDAVMTGYLGGAVTTHVRVGEAAFPVIFPIIVTSIPSRKEQAWPPSCSSTWRSRTSSGLLLDGPKTAA
jgi:hypothetical protein